MKEIWKNIAGYEDRYKVSSLGRVKTFCLGRMRILGDRYSYNYKRVSLYDKNSVPKNFSVHKLVIETFLGKTPEGMEVNHKNGNKKDNRVENLEFVTHKENVNHAHENGLVKNHGEDSFKSKLKNEDILVIRKLCLEKPIREISKLYKVDRNTIRQIMLGETWKHIYYENKDENIKKFLSSGLNSTKGEKNPFCKLTEKEAVQIRNLKGKRPQRIVAKFFNISQTTVWAIQNGKLWSVA